MIAAGQQRRRLRALTLALSLAILALLWVLRPSLRSLPGSLSAPLTIEAIESVILWLLWLVVALLAVALMFTAVRQRSRSSVALRRPRGASSRPPWRAYGTHSQPVSPLLVISARQAFDPPANGRAVVFEQRSVECAAPASDAIAPPTRAQVSVLGPLTIAGAKRSRRGLRKVALELVAYLALHRQPVQRDELLEAFWPGVDPHRTRPRLHQAVRDARRLLGAAIASDRDCYWLERAEVDVDLDRLERLLAEARVAGNDQVERQLLERALALFAGEPLAGSDYPWSEGELRRLRATHVELLERVGRIRLGNGEPRRALELAERALALDGLHEGLWRLALEAESALGLREAVDERYGRLRTLLAERLGLEPDRETRSLYRGLLAQG
jgi:DNA-binding SARP family transcriptional activator